MAAEPSAPPQEQASDDEEELRKQLHGAEGAESDDDEAGGSGAADANPEEGVKVLSKNQLKKIKRLELRATQKASRKAADKADRAAKSALVDAERAKKPPQTEESKKLAAEAKLYREQGKAEARKRVLAGPSIVIDCDFGPQMSDKDLKHLCQQLGYSYAAATRNGDTPCHLHLLGLKGRVKEMAEKQLSGIERWAATVSEKTHMEHFSDPEQLKRLVYLTADSTVEMTEVDPEKIYIIGGLVDHNSHKNICANRAAEQGLATARLPIQKYVSLETSAVLTVNQVMSILTQYVAVKDWAKVLDDVLPRRKRSDWVAGEAEREKAKAERKLAKAAGADPAAVPAVAAEAAGDGEKATGGLKRKAEAEAE